MVVSADLTDSQFEEFQDLASTVAENNDVAIAIPIIVYKVAEGLIYAAITLETLRRAKNIQEALEGSEIGVFRSPFPESSENTDNNTGGGSPDDVDTGTKPFDLGEATRIKPESIPDGNDFLERILDGQFEFPDVEESGSYFLSIETNPILSDLRESATLNNITSRGLREYREISGGFERANEIFDSLDLENVRPLNNPRLEGRIGILSDGRKIIVRSDSTSAGPTLEIQNAKGKIKDKFRFDP